MKSATLFCLLVIASCGVVWAGEPTAFDSVMTNYEPIRLTLLKDSMDGVAVHAKAIAEELEDLQTNFSHENVGADHATMMVVKEQLPGMIESANAMSSAVSIDSARDSFYELSMPLVQWREGLTVDDRPAVAFCPMHKKSWLQPGEKIGNPYGGMPGCGKIVSK